MGGMPHTKTNRDATSSIARKRYSDIAGHCDSYVAADVGPVHDLGNLIQVASSGLNLLSRDPQISAAPALSSIVGGARTALERAHALVRSTIARADRGQACVDHVNVGSCFVEIQALLGAGWKAGLQLEIQIAPDLPAVRCDRLALQNAVLNLLFNAKDAMPDGGLISVVATTSRNAEIVALRITDSGIGMSQETIVRAFEPFFTTKGSGLGGIGLPSVKRFAEDHGGHIEIQSVLGAGTTVTLLLPAVRDAGGNPVHVER
jgi:signal transduction histidine kinase